MIRYLPDVCVVVLVVYQRKGENKIGVDKKKRTVANFDMQDNMYEYHFTWEQVYSI